MTAVKNESIYVTETPEELHAKLKNYILSVVEPLMKCNGLISIGVSGGSMITLLCNIFSSMESLDWRRIRIFMVDERYVPIRDADSNCGGYMAKLPEAIALCVVQVPYDKSVARTASLYELTLKSEVQPEMIGRIPRFDLLFLGMGPDGHTASLFPGHRLLKHNDATAWVLYLEDSPKDPPRRVTLSLPCINVAKNVAFIVTGSEKAEVLKAVLDHDPVFPSALVKPMNRSLTFFLDKAAAGKL